MENAREQIPFDVLFVGGGPANLAGAIKLMALAKEKGVELEVALIEKGAEIGSHAVSGAILNPLALQELMPDYQEQGFPGETTIRGDAFVFLTAGKSFRVPVVPHYIHNTGFHVISLSKFTRWLAEKAEAMGVNIFPGFAGVEVLYDENKNAAIGVRTGDKGLDVDGTPKGTFEPGIDLMAKVTVFGEGARGSLARDIEKQMGIAADCMPQAYETGIKEVIQLPENSFFDRRNFNCIHLLGYPLRLDMPGGGFIYEMGANRIAIGYLVGLSYENPHLDIYDPFIQFKRHPFIADIIRGGKVIEQGARTVSTGGYFSIPKLAFNGGMLVGGCAGIHNVPALKGIHTAMKSGMLAAETILEALGNESFGLETLGTYTDRIASSWLERELYEGRNFYQALSKSPLLKAIYLGAQYLTRGKGIRDRMPIQDDRLTMQPQHSRAAYPMDQPEKDLYDNVLMVDKLTGVYLSRTMHREDQPAHLVIHDRALCANECHATYNNPCTRFCPGNVYEAVPDEGNPGRIRIKLNPSNCFHCKTCDIKDPYGNITWTCPEGGDGPGYTVV
ncbi:MAG: electron transfer flavoprotein-ubiquinone oxidoreductase [Deltaproteobacteria bacterium]|nr:electron transfer flavoprotein-ubiquinone oxidoreductase [Deltaproteobacteria bacterium]